MSRKDSLQQGTAAHFPSILSLPAQTPRSRPYILHRCCYSPAKRRSSVQPQRGCRKSHGSAHWHHPRTERCQPEQSPPAGVRQSRWQSTVKRPVIHDLRPLDAACWVACRCAAAARHINGRGAVRTADNSDGAAPACKPTHQHDNAGDPRQKPPGFWIRQIHGPPHVVGLSDHPIGVLRVRIVVGPLASVPQLDFFRCPFVLFSHDSTLLFCFDCTFHVPKRQACEG